MGKTVFVTGGSRGIGAAVVRRFTAEGWQAAFCYNNNQIAADRVSGETGALAMQADVSDGRRLSSCMKQARIYFGARSFDALVCCAGISVVGQIGDMTQDQIDRVIDVDLKGTINAVRAALPAMIAAGSGSIVMMSSMWGTRAASCESVYSAAKAGVIGFCRSIAAEAGPSGVRANVVAPGVINTDMNRVFSRDTLETLAERTPLDRIGLAEEVAEAVLFLADSRSSFVTGQVLGVDGGFSI